MTKNNRSRQLVISVIILVVGWGLALVLPELAKSHSLTVRKTPGAPQAPPECFATINNTSPEYQGGAGALQAAVNNASPGDVVKVAGNCKGVQSIAGLTQTVYISKSITLEGGHTESDWTLDSDPDTYPTTLNADKNGRVIVISGTFDVTLDSLFLTGGLTEDGPEDDGAGIWTNSGMTLTNSIIYSNTADGFGGGMHNDGVSPVLTNVTFSGNSAYSGGAILSWAPYGTSSPNLTNVTFSGNSANRDGGAMYKMVTLAPAAPI